MAFLSIKKINKGYKINIRNLAFLEVLEGISHLLTHIADEMDIDRKIIAEMLQTLMKKEEGKEEEHVKN